MKRRYLSLLSTINFSGIPTTIIAIIRRDSLDLLARLYNEDKQNLVDFGIMFCTVMRSPDNRSSAIKYKSFKSLLSLLMLVAVLNYIGPCDGRGGNIISITFQRIFGTYITNPFSTVEFTYFFTNVSLLRTDLIGFTYKANHPSKVVCLTEGADILHDDLNWNETTSNRFYFHSNVESTQQIPVHMRIGQDSRLFCKVVDLASESLTIYLFSSSPLSIRYSSLELRSLHRNKNVANFEITGKGLYFSYKEENEKYENGQVFVECSLMDLFSQNILRKINVDGQFPLFVEVNEREMIINGEGDEENMSESMKLECSVWKNNDEGRRVEILSKPLSIVVSPSVSEIEIVI